MTGRTFLAAICVASLGLVAGAATAQTQTAEGAQKFLSVVIQGGNARAFVVGDLKVRHLCTSTTPGACNGFPVEETRRYDYNAHTIERGASACQTRATSKPVNVAYHNSTAGNMVHSFEALQEPAILVADVDWGKAIIERGTWWHQKGTLEHSKWRPGVPNRVAVRSGGKAIVYATEDPELLDRIEYAMKFLKLSCDLTRNTGF